MDGAGASLQYTHHTVNHRRNFVDPRTGAHTQKIKNTSGPAKALLVRNMKGWCGRGANTQRGRAEADRILQTYLDWCWWRSLTVSSGAPTPSSAWSMPSPSDTPELKAWALDSRMYIFCSPVPHIVIGDSKIRDIYITSFLKLHMKSYTYEYVAYRPTNTTYARKKSYGFKCNFLSTYAHLTQNICSGFLKCIRIIMRKKSELCKEIVPNDP